MNGLQLKKSKSLLQPLYKMLLIALALALVSTCAWVPAYATSDGTINIQDQETGEIFEAPYTIEYPDGQEVVDPDDPEAQVQDEELPSSYYLNNLGFVTPPKVQSPWGTCWAFAVISAVESSILRAEAKLEASAGTGDSDALAEDAPGDGASADSTGQDVQNGLTGHPGAMGSANTASSAAQSSDAEAAQEPVYVEPDADMSAPRLTGLVDSIDLSERAIGWFAHETQNENTGDAQAGEGFSQGDSTDRLAQFEGGNSAIASAILAARQALMLESSAPYQYNDYTGNDVAWYDGGTFAGASDDARTRDWSLSNDLRITQETGWYVSGIRNLTSPAVLTTDFSTGTSTYLGYDPTATAAIKKTLTEIGAVAISMQADLSVPAEIAEGQMDYSEQGETINYETWAQYNGSSEVTLNHAVSIVGWDDSYPVDAFGSAQGGKPAYPGAWLCKNNWGSDTFYRALGNEDASIHWGIRDDQTQEATGFFWVSYYDHSLTNPVAFEVSPIGEDTLYQYDYLGTSEYEMPSTYTGDIKVANVFKAEDIELIDSVSAWTFSPGETVKTWIYALDDPTRDSKAHAESVHPVAGGTVSALEEPVDANLIADGDAFEEAMSSAQLLLEQTDTFEYAGFHTINLNDPVLVLAGEKFVVAQTVQTSVTGSDGQSVQSSYLNLEISFIDSLALQSISSASSVVANPGETFVSVAGEDVWDSVQEYNDWYADLKSQGNLPVDMVFGNALIKAMTQGTTMAERDQIYEVLKLDTKDVSN